MMSPKQSLAHQVPRFTWLLYGKIENKLAALSACIFTHGSQRDAKACVQSLFVAHNVLSCA
jgi:hypothetical protein